MRIISITILSLLLPSLSWAEEGSDELVFPFEVYPKLLEPNARIAQSTIVYTLCNDDSDNTFCKADIPNDCTPSGRGWFPIFTNEEGKIIESIHKARKTKEGIIINAGAYTHTSIAILDALRSYQGLIYEVHLSNIYAREFYRRNSYISEVSNGVICGLGFLGYELAIDSIVYN